MNKRSTDAKEDERSPKRSKSDDPEESPTITLTEEQHDILDQIMARKNVLAVAKAGAGKTTLGLACAAKFFEVYHARTLLITYNCRLKDETRERIKKMNLEPAVECHSYHACAFRFFVDTYKGQADDTMIHAALQSECNCEMDYGLIIIDENQDMNQLYYDLTIHIMKQLKNKPTLLLVGDIFQRLFSFNGATDKFLTTPEEYFATYCHSPEFVTRHLSTSFRISHEMADFINKNLNPCNLKHCVSAEWWETNGEKVTAFWGKGIRANPSRKPEPNSVEKISGWGAQKAIQSVKKMFAQFGNDQVALLAHSVKSSQSPLRAIVDKLGQNEDHNWMVMDGSASTTENLLRGKRVAATVHRFKGLERDGILYCGLDSHLEKVFKDADPLEHFNINYVACTRAKKKLIVNVCSVTEYATIRCKPLASEGGFRQTCDVSQLIEYVPFDEVLSLPANLFETKLLLNCPERAIKISRTAFFIPGRSRGTVEDLTPFLSRAILMRLMLLTGSEFCRVPLDAYMDSDRYDENLVNFFLEFYQQLETSRDVSWSDLIRYAIAHYTVKSKYAHLWRQLSHYDMPQAVCSLLDQCTSNALILLQRLAVQSGLVTEDSKSQELSAFLRFDVPIQYPFQAEWFCKDHTPYIIGSIDILFNHDIVIGIECGDSVPTERGLELQMYSCMRNMIDKSSTKAAYLILTNTAQLASVQLKISPLTDTIPIEYEFINRVIRRKLQRKALTAAELVTDFHHVPKPPAWLKLSS